MFRIIKVSCLVACATWSLIASSTEHNQHSLSRDARSANISELFSKVLELEENMRELTGKLQRAEHEQKLLLNKFNDVMKAKDEASHAQRQNTASSSTSADKGEVLYKQGLSAASNKMYDKAAAYFAKSYRYYSEIKSNEVLFKLIEVLSLEKKYEQACPLTKRISDKYLKLEQKTYLTELSTIHCQKKQAVFN